MECDGESKDIVYKIAQSYIATEKFLQSLIALKQLSNLTSDPLVQYQIGVTYAELNLYQEALPYFTNYNLNDIDSIFMAGLCYYKLGNNLVAIELFDNYLELNPNNIEIDYYKGLSYFHLNDFKNSAKHLKRVIKINTENSIALYHLGVNYLRLNKKREAKKTLNNLYYLDSALYDSLSLLIN